MTNALNTFARNCGKSCWSLYT